MVDIAHRRNPLILPILGALKEHWQGLSEYELMQIIRPQLEAISGIAEQPQLALFQQHFLIMNALYQLQEELLQEALHLDISPLKIWLQPLAEAVDQALSEPGELKLRAYYLDWNNLEQTDADEVDALLGSFWERYHLEGGELEEAMHLLGLPVSASWTEVRARYRTLVRETHPDKGGDAEEFMAIREAYEYLKRHYRQT